jgi:hypothetical protein
MYTDICVEIYTYTHTLEHYYPHICVFECMCVCTIHTYTHGLYCTYTHGLYIHTLLHTYTYTYIHFLPIVNSAKRFYDRFQTRFYDSFQTFSDVFKRSQSFQNACEHRNWAEPSFFWFSVQTRNGFWAQLKTQTVVYMY